MPDSNDMVVVLVGGGTALNAQVFYLVFFL